MSMGVTGAMVAVVDVEGAVVSLGFFLGLRGSAFICTMTFLATSEAKSFSHAANVLGWREFSQADGIHIHGIGISDGV